MKTGQLKDYAPQARRDFIAAVTDRAAFYGLTAEKIVEVQEQGDVAIIAGRPFARSVAVKRKKLEERIRQHGFEQVMEQVAYTWFNRLVAIRFMELHGYLDHGYRVLSHPEGKPLPEIVEHAEHVQLPGLDQTKVIELKLDGNKEAELYRLLLVAQCNALNRAMPFLFESIDDETELLLPGNLLHSDSLIRKLIKDIGEEDWHEVEIIGWLYQFYIQERYEQVIGTVVDSEDIPAATERFTPKWIVKYLVQNSLGRQWQATYPQSSLKAQMEYYIEPAEQLPEVQAKLKEITPTGLNPEEITLLDPACGSGHILVEAYDLLKAMYQERGYRAKDIPGLILEKNLFGLEIDDRAAQLAAFAVMMKARADDRRIFDSEAKPNILAFQSSRGMNAAEITHALNSPTGSIEEGRVSQGDIASLLTLFENAKTFGSLIRVPPKVATKVSEIEQRLSNVLKYGDLTHAPAHVIKPFLQQASLLGRRYDAVVANPPYMGSKFFIGVLKDFMNAHFKNAKADLCVAFIERGVELTKPTGCMGQVTMQSWMFLSSFQKFRLSLLEQRTITTMAHLGPNAFPQVGGQVVQVTAFSVRPVSIPSYRGSFKRLVEGSSEEKARQFHVSTSYTPSNADFQKIPGSPVAYWIADRLLAAFARNEPLENISATKIGMRTGENARFLRRWFEVDWEKAGIGFSDRTMAKQSGLKWFPYNKGGEFRKWYGNNEYVVNWQHDGQEIKDETRRKYPELGDDLGWKITNESYYFRPSLSWSFVSSSAFGVRASQAGFLFDVGGSCTFPSEEYFSVVAAFLCSHVAFEAMKCLNPTLNFQIENVACLPLPTDILSRVKDRTAKIGTEAIRLSCDDWNSSERSWDFQVLPIFQVKTGTLEQSQQAADALCLARFARMKELEEENNRLFIDAYGLQDRLSSEVPDDQISLCRPNREDDIRRLISYAIGCTMGRYSLDEPGLVYAHSGNKGFDPSQYMTFPADPDGIIPVTEFEWFDDDAAKLFELFITTAWPKQHVEENLTFVAESIDPKAGESSRDTIRRYLATGFYKHHLSIYKRRPIYWLFSSGKQRAFQALVYLHRYNEGTLSRMRTEYAVPLLGKISARIGHLDRDITGATGKHRRDLEKEQATLKKQLAELQEYDDKLRHYADRRIALDLDDGVKVNYAKFGELLAEVKAVTGGDSDD